MIKPSLGKARCLLDFLSQIHTGLRILTGEAACRDTRTGPFDASVDSPFKRLRYTFLEGLRPVFDAAFTVQHVFSRIVLCEHVYLVWAQQRCLLGDNAYSLADCIVWQGASLCSLCSTTANSSFCTLQNSNWNGLCQTSLYRNTGPSNRYANL